MLLGVAMILAEMLIPGFGVMGIIGVAVVAAALYFVYDLKGALIGSIILAVTLVFLVVMAVVMRRALSPEGGGRDRATLTLAAELLRRSGGTSLGGATKRCPRRRSICRKCERSVPTVRS